MGYGGRSEKSSLTLITPALITTILFHPEFPVDVRHNIKISREALAVWAAEQRGRAGRSGQVQQAGRFPKIRLLP